MDPTDHIPVGNQRLERNDGDGQPRDNSEKLSGSSDEEGSVDQHHSNSDHSESDEDHYVENKSQSGRSAALSFLQRVFQGGSHAPPNREEGRKKHRRQRKAGLRHIRRSAKPYERSEEEEQRRMLLRAPKNTTQYIMDDHPDCNSSPGTNANSSEETYRRGLNDFKNDYLDSAKEQYKQLTKPQLIRRVMELESNRLLVPRDRQGWEGEQRLEEAEMD